MRPDDGQTAVVDDPRPARSDGAAGGDGEARALPPVSPRHCAFCGLEVEARRPSTERFGESFCSEAHAEAFVDGVRAARVRAAASATPETRGEIAEAEGDQTAGGPSWTDRLKKWGCWGAPLLLLVALPLIWSGSGVAAAAGSLLSVLALLACPIAMLLMMRNMGSMNQGGAAHHRQHADDDGQPRPDKAGPDA